MSLIHFEVHYNYVGGPPPSLWRSTVQWTLMDWHVAESYPSRDSHPVRLKRTRHRSDYSANLQAYVLCLESLCGSHQPIRGFFQGKCIVDAGWDQEMPLKGNLPCSLFHYVSQCLVSISMKLIFFWWSNHEKSSWSISIRLPFAHGSPLWVSRQGAHLHSEQEDGATNSFGNLAQHFAASSFRLMRGVLMRTTVGRKGFVDQWILGAWPFSCRGAWSRATHAVPLGVGIHTHVCTQFMFFFLSVVYRLSHWHASFRTHTHIEMVRRASHAKTHCHSLQNAILHQSKKEQNALAHWTCCMFFVNLFLAKLVQPYKYNMHWHSLVFYQPQLYILPCLTKATKAKCTGTKTKSMHCFVYMFFYL